MDDRNNYANEADIPGELTVIPRKETDYLEETNWRSILQQLNPLDLVSRHNHSTDFNGSRADYIHARVRILAILFGILTPLWVPIDYVVLGSESIFPILVLRIISAVLMFTIGFAHFQRHSLEIAYLRLFALITVLDLFYVGVRLQLGGGIADGALIGYTFIPFLVVALLAVFPLALVEGLVLSLFVMFTHLILEIHFETVISVGAFSDFWLMGLLAGIALWAQVAQLHMLLSLYRQATRDTLTGLFNRRALMHRLDMEVERAQRYNRNLTVLMLDLDRFKRINDTYGHLTGDAVLKVFSEVLEKTLRSSDLVGRYGGEEFLAILPESARGPAADVAERIRIACQVSTACGPEKCVTGFTTSVGLAQHKHDETAEDLLNRVDSALYEAKAGGRNRIIVAA